MALQAMNIGGGNAVVDEPSGRLDFNWVMRWLDDLGLPQYKVIYTPLLLWDGNTVVYANA